MSKDKKNSKKQPPQNSAAEVVEKTDAPEEQTITPEEQTITPEEQTITPEMAVAELQDKLLRLQAEFQNYRKRTAKDIATARMHGLTETIIPFLQVFDHFSMAVTAAEKSDNMDAIRQGLEMILGEYSKALEELGVEKLDATGQEFNPDLHEAMANEPSEEIEEGKIIKQWSYGYKLGERLLRPAAVVVSSGPKTVAENNDN